MPFPPNPRSANRCLRNVAAKLPHKSFDYCWWDSLNLPEKSDSSSSVVSTGTLLWFELDGYGQVGDHATSLFGDILHWHLTGCKTLPEWAGLCWGKPVWQCGWWLWWEGLYPAASAPGEWAKQGPSGPQKLWKQLFFLYPWWMRSLAMRGLPMLTTFLSSTTSSTPAYS